MNNEQLKSFYDNIRTPLDMIVDYAKRIADADDREMRKLYAETIESNSKIIRQMMQLFQSQLDSPSTAPAPAPTPAPAAAPTPEPAPTAVLKPRPADTGSKPLILIA